MSKVYITNQADGGLDVTYLNTEDLDDVRLTKVLFELSRTTDRTTHFDPEIHTREAIASGLDGHRALALLAECEDTDLPADRYFRDAWTWED